MALAQNVEPTELGGLTGWVAQVIDSVGALGIALLVALENIIPPIPSEVVLLMAGYLASEGSGNVVLAAVAATAGSVGGAVLLYYLGRGLGEDRLKRWLDRIPLVDLDDLEKADRWFERHARATVLLGRLVPVVRSVVSIPAGANRMPLPEFLALTALGSGVWNSLFVGLGYALGSQWQQVERYNDWFNYAIFAFFGVSIASWATKKIRKRRARQRAGTAG
ncbi:DedA family protein [Plantactinospora sp. GCM10030261]|uniref:DedA family protein n=1 Tax=Plantactinospora sp. GCM10030261 TaxID=3273420 RepID=UPI003609365C